MKLLEVKGLTKRFGGLVALDQVDLALDGGRIVSVIGPNGAGKTTLFHMLTGIYRPDGGEILFLGRSLAGLRPDEIAAAGIGRTFQNIRLFPHMTVIDNILAGMHLLMGQRVRDVFFHPKQLRAQEKDARLRALYLLGLMGLQGKGGERAHELSYGDQRRLEIARALAAEPKLLLLDEPTAGMNLSEAQSLMKLTKKLIGEFVQSILLIEHNMRVVMGISDHVVVFDYGEKIADGSPNEVCRNARVIEAYLGRGKWSVDA